MSSPSSTPVPLTEQSWPSDCPPTLSIFCLTYNHEKFVAQCLDGFLLQATSFPVEIIVHDDASTDRTAEIVREYAARHPALVRTLLQTTNQLSQGHSPLSLIGQVARGKFVAICEGDDFWTASDKLEQQVSFLRSHPECSGCFHNAQLVDAEGTVLLESYFHDDHTTFTQTDVLESLLSREPTCSLVFRREGYDPLPGWFLRRPCDLYLDIHLTARGPLHFIGRNMAAYRRHSGGIWSSERQAHQLVELIVRYRLLETDATFGPQHRDLLRRKIAEFQAGLFAQSDFDQEIVRLRRMVEEQTTLIDRLRAFTASVQNDVDSLNVQVSQLAETIERQRAYIAKFEQAQSPTGWIGQLQAHVARAERTITEQTSYIAKFEQAQSPTGWIGQLQAHVAQAERTITEQTSYIAKFEQAQSPTGWIGQLQAHAAQAERTITEQHAYITSLKAQRDRLEIMADEHRREAQRLGHICVEQLNYIRALEAQRKELTTSP